MISLPPHRHAATVPPQRIDRPVPSKLGPTAAHLATGAADSTTTTEATERLWLNKGSWIQLRPQHPNHASSYSLLVHGCDEVLEALAAVMTDLWRLRQPSTSPTLMPYEKLALRLVPKNQSDQSERRCSGDTVGGHSLGESFNDRIPLPLAFPPGRCSPAPMICPSCNGYIVLAECLFGREAQERLTHRN